MRTRAPLLSALVVAALAARGSAQDAVVFKDGYTVRGRVMEERPGDYNGVLSSAKLDFLNSGPRFVFFSSHARKEGGQVAKGAVPPEDKALVFDRVPRALASGSTKRPLPAVGELVAGKYNADWRSTLEIRYPRQPSDKVEWAITRVTPTLIKEESLTHNWRRIFDPREFGPAEMRRLLSSHPSLTDGWLPAPDPMRRMTIAQYLKEVGWYSDARLELARLKKDAPWAWAKEATERFDKLSADLDAAETKWALDEVEVALAAGQYRAAGAFLKGFDPKSADQKDLTKLTELRARVEDVQPKYDKARQLLRDLIDREGGNGVRAAHGAVGGGSAFQLAPKKTVPPETAALLDGAEAVYRELHPDTLGRIDLFVVQATQEEKRAAAKQEPNVKPNSLLALAVSGWVSGKSGAALDPAVAVRVWDTRQMLVAYLRDSVENNRTGHLKRHQQKYPLPSAAKPDDYVVQAQELAQIVTLLPPIDAEDLAAVRGRKVDPKEAGAPDVYRIDTGPVPDDAVGLTYYVRLPREYQHGRAYPVILALNDVSDPLFGAEKMIGLLAAEADRNGFILASPVWSAPGQRKFDYSGKDHRVIASTIRDLSRKFQVDQDRVFAFGFGEGGNFAFDLSMSRPDLLAGVVCMSPYPVGQFYSYYWKNAQKCAVYCVTGELAGPAVGALRSVYDSWLPYGFYAILSVYKGRGGEFFFSELPTLFDWMTRKRRVRGVGSLRLDNRRFESWQTCRDTDTRFYWVGATELAKGNKLVNPERPDKVPFPAEFFADLKNNEVIVSNVRGVKQITVWLERDMIDWTKPVKARVESNVTGFKPKLITPDVPLMLEELYRTGDRKMLFFGRLEFKTNG